MLITDRDPEFRETVKFYYRQELGVPREGRPLSDGEIEGWVQHCREGWTGPQLQQAFYDSAEGVAWRNKPKTLPRITTSGRDFIADGQPIVTCGASNFLLFQRYLEGHDIEPLLYPGFNSYRITLSMKYIPNLHGLKDLRPENYPGFFGHLGNFCDRLNVQGKYVESTILCDQQSDLLNTTKDWQRGFVRDCVDVLREKTNASVVSLGNEFSKNGFDPNDFQKPLGVVFSFGSALSDEAPPRPSDSDWREWHGRRDWPKVFLAAEDMWFVREGIEAVNGTFKQVRPPAPARHNEPVGFGPEPNRSQDLELARVTALASRAFGNDAVFHSSEGVASLPFSPITTACGNAFKKAMLTV